MRGIGVEKASAICAQLLDRDLGRRRTLRDRLRFTLKRGGRRIGSEVLNHALRAEQKGANQCKRQQDVYGSPHRSTQKLPIVFCCRRANPRISAIGNGHPGRGRNEILHGQRDHLDEITQGRFAAISLPVRICHEADGGIEGKIRRCLLCSETRRIQRQDSLKRCKA